jgi:hypothetical protein
MGKDKNKDDINLKKYHDLGGLTISKMNIGLWFSEKRKSLTRALTIFLIVISAFFFVYSTYNYVLYFLSGAVDNQAESQVTSPRNVVTEMAVAPTEIFKNNDNYDLAALLKNPNDSFSAEFDYCFTQGETEIYCNHSFVLPSEQKYALALGVKLDSVAVSPGFKIKDIFWSRVNKRIIPDWQAYHNARLNFTISDITYLSASRSGLSENLKLNSLSFKAVNNSPYSYYEVPFDILLYSGSRLVGITRSVASNFLAGETRDLKLSWAGDQGSVSRVEITPRININDQDVYLKYQGSSN